MAKRSYEFRQCNPDHLPELLLLQQEALEHVPTGMLRENTEQTLSRCLNPPHFVLGAFSANALAGFAILYLGGESLENLGLDLEVEPEELPYVANLKLIIVGRRFQGQGLQKQLCRRVEAVAKEMGIRMICATVSPENSYSANNLLAVGYRHYRQLEKYGGLLRDLYYKPVFREETVWDRLYLSAQELLDEKKQAAYPGWTLIQAVADRVGLNLHCDARSFARSIPSREYHQLRSGDVAVFRKKNSRRPGIVLGQFSRQLLYPQEDTGIAAMAPLLPRLDGWQFEKGYALGQLLDGSDGNEL